MNIAEACEKLTELCHEGKALEQLYIKRTKFVTDVDDEDGSLITVPKEELVLADIGIENGRIFIAENPFVK